MPAIKAFRQGHRDEMDDGINRATTVRLCRSLPASRPAGVTHQRQEIYRELAQAEDHPSAEALHHRLQERFPTISLDTVYRTLATFAGCGLINKVDTVESQG